MSDVLKSICILFYSSYIKYYIFLLLNSLIWKPLKFKVKVWWNFYQLESDFFSQLLSMLLFLSKLLTKTIYKKNTKQNSRSQNNNKKIDILINI